MIGPRETSRQHIAFDRPQAVRPGQASDLSGCVKSQAGTSGTPFLAGQSPEMTVLGGQAAQPEQELSIRRPTAIRFWFVFPEEVAAAAIVAKVTGGTVGDRSGRHDADIVSRDGATIGP